MPVLAIPYHTLVVSQHAFAFAIQLKSQLFRLFGHIKIFSVTEFFQFIYSISQRKRNFGLNSLTQNCFITKKGFVSLRGGNESTNSTNKWNIGSNVAFVDLGIWQTSPPVRYALINWRNTCLTSQSSLIYWDCVRLIGLGLRSGPQRSADTGMPALPMARRQGSDQKAINDSLKQIQFWMIWMIIFETNIDLVQ